MIDLTRPRFAQRGIGAVALVLATAFAVSGCSASSSIASETIRGLPPGITLTDDEQLGEQPVAIWTDNRVTLTVVTWGSSSCPAVPTSLTLNSAMLLTLAFAPPTDQVCTADYAPTSHVFSTPDGISFSAVQLEITFEARSGDEPVELTIPIRDPE